MATTGWQITDAPQNGQLTWAQLDGKQSSIFARLFPGSHFMALQNLYFQIQLYRVHFIVRVPLCEFHRASFFHPVRIPCSIVQVSLCALYRASSTVWIPSREFHRAHSIVRTPLCEIHRANSIIKFIVCEFPCVRILSYEFYRAHSIVRIPFSAFQCAHSIVRVPSVDSIACAFHRVRNLSCKFYCASSIV